MTVSVSDLKDYRYYCKRRPWLSKVVSIDQNKVDFSSKLKFHVVYSMTDFLQSTTELQSMTDTVFKIIERIPGKIVEREVLLGRGNLCGRVDVIRKTRDGYIVQEEKSSEPPERKGWRGEVYPSDKLQVDAYAFLMENSKYTPLIHGIILYNDLKPRKVKPNPAEAKEILDKVTKLLESDTLPDGCNNKKKCLSCGYYSLCQVLPIRGGLTADQMRALPDILATGRFWTPPKEDIRIEIKPLWQRPTQRAPSENKQ